MGRSLLGDPAEPIEDPLQAVLDGHGRMSVPRRQRAAGDALELELDKQAPLFAREPSGSLAVVEEAFERDFRPKRIRIDGLVAKGGSVLLGQGQSRFLDGPAKHPASKLARNVKRHMRTKGAGGKGRKQLEEENDDVLRDVVSAEWTEGRSYLTGRAMDGRNENQEQKPLPSGACRSRRVLAQHFPKQVIRRRRGGRASDRMERAHEIKGRLKARENRP